MVKADRLAGSNADLCTMNTVVTQGVRVTAQSRYEAALSDPKAGRYLFSYRITIANHGVGIVQLKRRRWNIWDSLAAVHEVEGPGVVGETPTLAPGEAYSYQSACMLCSGLGRMRGSYIMCRPDGSEFEVRIPEMVLEVPFAAN